MDQKRTSTKSESVEQLSLIPAKRVSAAVDVPYLVALPNFRRAVRYSMSLADLEPKQVYDPLGKDKATWSRIEGGDMGFPADLIIPFQAITQNDALVMWLNHHSGWDVNSMRRQQDDKDRRIFELEKQLAEERREKEVIARFVRETVR